MNAVGTGASRRPRFLIDPDTSMGAVRLTMTDLARSRTFYEQALGLRSEERADGTVAFGVGAGAPLTELRGDSSAAPLDPGKTGLYHLAILMSSRTDLAFTLAPLAEARWPQDGASARDGYETPRSVQPGSMSRRTARDR